MDLKDGRLDRCYLWVLTRPQAALLVVALGILTVVGSLVEPHLLARWAPEPREALGNAWQVHTAFLSIGIAGIAIAFQAFPEPPLAAGPARRAVVDFIAYRGLLLQGAAANALLAIGAVWLASDVNVVLGTVFVLAPSVVLVLIAYARLARIFSDPHQIEVLTVANLRKGLLLEILRMEKDAEAAAAHRGGVNARPYLLARSGTSPDEGFAVTYQGEPTTLVRWDFTRLDSAKALLDGPLGPKASESPAPEEADVTGARVRLLLRPGSPVMPGNPILRVSGLRPDTEPRRLQGAQRTLLAAAITGGDDWRARIRAEMADLEDGVLEAIRAGRLGRTERGYTYYREVIDWIRLETRRRGSNAAPEQLRWIESQTWEVDDAAVQAGSRFAMAATSAAQDRCTRAVRSNDLPALQAALLTFPHAWRLLLDQPGSSEDAQEHVLVALQNIAEFLIPAELAGKDAEVDSAKACIWTFVEMIKHSLDGPGLDSRALRALDYMSNLYRFGRRDLDAALDHKNAGLIALAAWVMYCQEELGKLAGVDPAPLLERLDGRSVGEALRILDERHESAGQWRFWETRDALPIVAQSLELGSFAVRVGLLAMRGSPGFRIRNDEDLSLAQRLIHASERTGATDPAQFRVATTVEALKKMISEWDEKQNLILAGLPLDDSRVDAFIKTLRESLVDPPRLLDLFVGQTTSASWSTVGQRRVLGMNVIVPKVFFVESPRTIAPPEDLGRQLANAMVRGEEASIVEQCLHLGREHSARVADLRTLLSGLVIDMIEPVAIASSYEALAALGVRDFETGEVRLNQSAIRVVPLFVDNLDGKVILVDRLHSLDALREPEAREELEPLADVGVAVGVFTHPSKGSEPRARVELGELLQWRAVEEPRIHTITVIDEADTTGEALRQVS